MNPTRRIIRNYDKLYFNINNCDFIMKFILIENMKIHHKNVHLKSFFFIDYVN